MREELEEKLHEHLNTAAEQEKMMKNKLEGMENEIAELKVIRRLAVGVEWFSPFGYG